MTPKIPIAVALDTLAWPAVTSETIFHGAHP
jgi:hypothetical protein